MRGQSDRDQFDRLRAELDDLWTDLDLDEGELNDKAALIYAAMRMLLPPDPPRLPMSERQKCPKCGVPVYRLGSHVCSKHGRKP
jgi:hypothetical protein